MSKNGDMTHVCAFCQYGTRVPYEQCVVADCLTILRVVDLPRHPVGSVLGARWRSSGSLVR